MTNALDYMNAEHLERCRYSLKSRYKWEIQAIAEDVANKLQMGILINGIEVKQYLKELILSHPRIKALELSYETMMCHDRHGEPHGDIVEQVLGAMTHDVLEVLKAHHKVALEE
jgi:hypothetical protein